MENEEKRGKKEGKGRKSEGRPKVHNPLRKKGEKGEKIHAIGEKEGGKKRRKRGNPLS